MNKSTAIRSGDHITFGQRYGTNEGGWYRDQETGNRKYVKLYKSPDQARVEALANSIYNHVDIPAAHSELYDINGRLAIASDEIFGGSYVGSSELRRRPEVLGGFATDALLGNYDVFGLSGDNVVQDPSGIIHRIDNGGSLQFRARGRIKAFPHDDIPELNSMRDPNVIPMSDPSIAQSTAGRVYSVLSENDMQRQAQHLYEGLSPDDINRLIDRVEFPDNTHEFVTAALLGRRAFLRRRFDL